MSAQPTPGERLQAAFRLGLALRLVWHAATGWTIANLAPVALRGALPLAWRQEIGVAFHGFAHYAMTARENVWLRGIEKSYDAGVIVRAAAHSGADAVVRKPSAGHDTVLGRWFRDGQELSTGAWRRLAMARAFWREARVLILDEPSSAVEPMTEAAPAREFRTLVAGRSALVVSHGRSTVQMQDRLCVLDEGRIRERGTLEGLLAPSGLCAKLYRAQTAHCREALL